MFIDRITVECHAGKGGNGVIAWRREKYIPKGGPTGGDGGKGASIIFEGDENEGSLERFVNWRIVKAPNGAQGQGACKAGKNGQDLVLKVPCGTLIKDVETNELLYDVTNHQERFILCRGGRGGKGNFCFKSSTNRAPNICTPGQKGEFREVELELKLIADVGLVGFPNAGKSTLLSTLANRNVKIGAYPFTTLHPNIGQIRYPDHEPIVIADIPGIIEGAHRDRGLGLEFLRHIERTKVLLFVVDISGFEERSGLEDFMILQKELKAYDPDLLQRPFLIVLNKMDIDGAQEHADAFLERFKRYKKHIHCISSQQGTGLDTLKLAIRSRIS
jgi:GTP-binding protein